VTEKEGGCDLPSRDREASYQVRKKGNREGDGASAFARRSQKIKGTPSCREGEEKKGRCRVLVADHAGVLKRKKKKKEDIKSCNPSARREKKKEAGLCRF